MSAAEQSILARPRQRYVRVALDAEAKAGIALAAPGICLLALLILLPSVAVFVVALTDWQLGAPVLRFVGLRNFIALASDVDFRTSFCNTVIYVVVVAPVTVTLALLLAILIEQRRSLRTLYRSLHFLPVMATFSAMAIAWEALLHPTIGLINLSLNAVGLSGANWLRDPDIVLATLMVIGIWQHLGYALVLFIAGLKAIPRDLYDAAAVDGVEAPFDRLAKVTLPMLGPALMFIVAIVTLRALQTFDAVAILTKGGPGNASDLLLHSLYVESFLYFRTGYGSAMAVIFLLMVVAVTLLQARLLEKRVHYT